MGAKAFLIAFWCVEGIHTPYGVAILVQKKS